MNWGTPDIAAEAQEEILGKDHAYPMIAFGTCKKKSAFKLYARSQNMDFDLANTISGQIEKYENALKYADDDEKDEIDIYDYVDKEYHSYIDASKKYQGIIMDKKKAPCFPAGTLIYTSYGYIPIENIKVGMNVMTHTGEFHKVLYVNKTENQPLWSLSVMGREDIILTANHPIYHRKLQRKKYITDKGTKSIKRVFEPPKWTITSNIKPHDVVGSPINKNSKIPNYFGLEQYMDNENFWWVIGRYVGDGWCEYYERENRRRIKICCNKTDKELNEIKSHIDGLIDYRIDECNKIYKFILKDLKLFDFLQMFERYANHKKIPQIVIDLPINLLKAFVEGYVSADGHYIKDKNEFVVSSVSKELIYGFQQCVHKVYRVPTQFYTRKSRIDVIEQRQVNCKESYILRYHLDKRKNDRGFYEDGYIWYWVRNVNSLDKNDCVYNFEVEKDNSYTAYNISVHNCAYLLYDGSIREEIGLIKCKSETTKKEYMTAVIDGAIAENYKFLKNDILKVDVVLLIDLIYKRIGLKHHTVNELMELVKNDQAVWDIYANGYTMGVNQVEKASTTRKSMKYKPRNVSELSAFIAAIRPAFKSMYSKLENREDFSYGIPAFDKILQTEELPQSFILYQEQTMNTLNYAGFPIDECYGIIKAIAKKHPEKVKPLKERFITGFKDKIMQDDGIPADKAEEDSARVWQIISDSCGYGFNSAHAYCMALDSLYNAYLKAHYPYEFYEVLLQTYSDKGKKDKVAELKQEMSKAFGIKEGEYKFGLDNRKFKADPDNQTIYPSLLSIKGLSQGCANDLYAMGQKKYENFYELWKDMKKKKNLNSGKVNTLIEIGYFDDFGTIGKIKRFIDILDQLYDRSQFSKSNPPVEFLPIIRKYSEETDKQYRKFDYDAALTEIWETLEDTDIPFNERLKYELQNIGYVKTLVPDMSPDYAFVQEYECKYKNPKLTLYRLADGSTEIVKVRRKKYDEAPINVGDIIKTIECSEEGRWSKDNNGDWQQDNSDKESILKKWSFVRDEAKEDE